MNLEATAVARLAVLFTYVLLLGGAALVFRPVRDRSSHGRLFLLSFIAMTIAGNRLPASSVLLIPAFACLAASLALFVWGALAIRGRYFSYVGSKDVPQFVFQGGPFAYIRNPFYTSYLFAHTAAAMIFPSWITALILAASAWFSYRVALFEEAKFAASPHAAEYREYAARTGRFLPGL